MITIILLGVILCLLLLQFRHTRLQRKRVELYFSILKLPDLAGQVRKVPGFMDSWRSGRADLRAGKNLDQKRLTLVIPTHNRISHLSRALDYYGAWNVDILVMDSTPAPYRLPLPSNVRYFHRPALSFGEKLNEALAQVSTPYVLISADDDFISAVAVKASIEYMDQNASCACAQGWHAGFSPAKRKVRWLAMHLFAMDYHVDSGCAEERIQKQASNYMNCFYALHRTKVMQSFFCDISPTLPTDIVRKRPDLLEVCQALNSVTHGSHVVLPHLWIAREMIANSAGNAPPPSSSSAGSNQISDEDEVVFKQLSVALSPLLPSTEAETILQQALNNIVCFRQKWSRQMFSHFGPVENVLVSPLDRAFVNRVDRIVRKHPMSV